MANQVLKCKSGGEYEVNLAEWGCEFMLKFEKPYELMEGWDKFAESEFEKEITASNIAFSRTPIVSQEIEAPKVQGSEATSATSTKKTAGYYISARENLHSIDSETESEKCFNRIKEGSIRV